MPKSGPTTSRRDASAVRDRMVDGLIAGLIGGAVAKAWSLFSYHILHFTELLMLDWLNAIFIGHAHKNAPEWVLGFLGVWFWFMFLGVGLSYFYGIVGTKAYLVKGVAYGLGVQYGIYTVTGLFKLHDVAPVSWRTVGSDYVVAVLFGLVAAYVLKRLNTPA